ncbi:AAA-type ATPase family protein [Striga hermonthica]|uniref:AAA-type ATPase family protein n=1 Tax=Striga hermonthica TaxID=68872 RepID=A0A9N7RQA9_STRHE|nr:AAA-type ATPase family protein [Striga hermonthica]
MSLHSTANLAVDILSPKPLCVFRSSKTLLARNERQPKFWLPRQFCATRLLSESRRYARPRICARRLRINCCQDAQHSNSQPVDGETNSAELLFENLKEAERERINKLEEFERRANVQLERQLMMASEWSRALLTMRGKLKGTEWDPEVSHSIDYSDFKRLLDSNNVQFMEYSNYGQSVSVILPYYKDGKMESSEVNENKEIVFRRHVVDRMPIDCWNDVWRKLHQQLVNVDVHNVNSAHAEVYSSVATAVVWSMRLALSIALYVWIDNTMRPIYAKLIPCDLGDPPKRTTPPLLSRKGQALGSLGKSRAKFISAEKKTGVTFDDFAGQEYIKRELIEIVQILTNAEEFKNKGIYCPKGVLLHGPPGTGKTLLAKAIAGEAGLPFFAASGTDFVEMFAGVAASRVRDLFSNARSYAPSIIFIDEIDAIGGKRGGPDIGGGGVEREQGLLQMLTEMDGFKVSTAQVLVIGATNRLDILDPALLRKGRFDKIIRVGLPSRDGRYAILKVHARNKYFCSEEEKETLLQELADLTENFTGAELQNILNEAGILTARKDLDYIGRGELLEALTRQKGTFETGQEDSIEVPEELKLRLAYREAAVAVLACYIPDNYRPFSGTEVKSISSDPNMRYKRTSGRVFQRKADYVDSIIRACAPRVIEEEIFGVDNLCWISPKSLLEASRRIEFLILKTGTTAFGKAYYRSGKDLVPNLAAKLEALREEYIRFAVEKCSSVIRECRPAFTLFLTDVLLEKGEIKADEIWKIYNSSPRIPQPAMKQLDEYGALVYAGRWGIHGVSLPGRVTFAPGNVGYSSFGAPRPMETQAITDDMWKLVDGVQDNRPREIREEVSREMEEPQPQPQLLMAGHFL